MPRIIWKGAISFGLVHVPVALYAASSETGIDFDWIDKRSMDPVGYKRINKRTGKEITKEDIVRGVKLPGGDYVILGDDEIKAAYPKTMQTIAIESFTSPTLIPFTHLEKPFYLEPLPKAEKVYALLREAMAAAGVVGISRVVMHTKEYLAALIPVGPALMLNTLRWGSEVRPAGDLKLPQAGQATLKDAELKMAGQLIADMREDWQADRYQDQFTQAVQELVDQRAAAGRTAAVKPLEDGGTEVAASNVVDLTELLKRSLGKRKDGGNATAALAAPAPADAEPAATKTAAKTAIKAAPKAALKTAPKPAARKTAARKRA